METLNQMFSRGSHADTFLEILNEQDPTIKCAVEFKGHKHSPNFLNSNNITNKNMNSNCIKRTQS